jgi:hypothetical protein
VKHDSKHVVQTRQGRCSGPFTCCLVPATPCPDNVCWMEAQPGLGKQYSMQCNFLSTVNKKLAVPAFLRLAPRDVDPAHTDCPGHAQFLACVIWKMEWPQIELILVPQSSLRMESSCCHLCQDDIVLVEYPTTMAPIYSSRLPLG